MKTTENKNSRMAIACVKTLKYLQKIAKYLNPAFYLERKVPHYEVLKRTITQSEEAENYTLNVIEKELLIYKSFVKINPLRFETFGEALKKAEHEYAVMQIEREEIYDFHLTGLRLVAKKIVHYIETPTSETIIEVSEMLTGMNEEELSSLWNQIIIEIKPAQNN